MYGANKYARPQPEKMVTSGVTMMSTFVFLLTSVTELCRDDGEHEHRERTACAAERVCRAADCDEREQYERGRLQRVADGDRHSGTGCGLCIPANLIEQRNVKLCAERGNDGADEQGSKKPLCHGAHGIDKVAVQIHLDLLSFLEEVPSIFVQSFLFTERERFSGAPGFTQTCAAQNTRERIYIDYVARLPLSVFGRTLRRRGVPGLFGHSGRVMAVHRQAAVWVIR